MLFHLDFIKVQEQIRGKRIMYIFYLYFYLETVFSRICYLTNGLEHRLSQILAEVRDKNVITSDLIMGFSLGSVAIN